MYGEEQIRQWYGRPLCSSDVMPKILWIKNKEPDIYAKTHKFLTGSSFIAAKLTGNYVVDRFLDLQVLIHFILMMEHQILKLAYQFAALIS